MAVQLDIDIDGLPEPVAGLREWQCALCGRPHGRDEEPFAVCDACIETARWSLGLILATLALCAVVAVVLLARVLL